VLDFCCVQDYVIKMKMRCRFEVVWQCRKQKEGRYLFPGLEWQVPPTEEASHQVGDHWDPLRSTSCRDHGI